ncbi:Activator of 90 kDa heat shock protein ATPase -like protein 1 [Halotydeus destructor]|nr:Activator of 90 kDa heat shock protein ATPase -like protein 1 [Halotydeus destructor]
MAKWGEGDPRWIVEERPDATNVNNWHWSEKNASQWSKDKLKELLLDLKVDDPNVGKAEIYEIESIEGEAVANNRKAKLIFFYEWVIKAKWKGLLNGSSAQIKGTIEIPNLSEENDADEVDVVVSLKKETEAGTNGDALKELMRVKGQDLIRKQLEVYISQLKTDFAKDLIKPTKESATTTNTNSVVSETGRLSLNTNTGPKPAGKPLSVGEKLAAKDLSLREEFKCRKEEIYRTFTTLELVSAFTRGPAVVEAKASGKFSMFDGNVTGTFVSLKQDEEIKQKWRFRSWPDGYYSDVTISFEDKEDHTNVVISQKGIPENDFERTENGWKQFYFHSIKQTFGFGAMLY